MSDCGCNPGSFPFHCSKFNENMGYDEYEACSGRLGPLAKIQQEKRLCAKLRQENACDHLGPKQANGSRLCALYGSCTETFLDNSLQSCDLCADHTAIANILLPIAFADQFVPFDGGKGSDSSIIPEIGACCKPQTPPNCATNDDCDCLERWILEECEAEGGDFDASVICIDENTSTPPCNCAATECRFPG